MKEIKKEERESKGNMSESWKEVNEHRREIR